MKILCLATTSPLLAVHNYRELTILKALQLRGAEVDYYQCDCNGLVCYAFPPPAPQSKLPKVCRRCGRDGKKRAQEIGIDVKSISPFFTQEIRDKAAAWVASLAPEDFPNAVYGKYELGAWMMLTVISLFRMMRYRPGNRGTDDFYRMLLEDGLRRALALERLFDAGKYDRVLLFNARMGANKITHEVAKLRGIPVFVHEVGWPKDTMAMDVDELAVTFPRLRRVWDMWKDIPLSKEEIENVALYQFQRELGNEATIAWCNFTVAKTGASTDELRKRLGIAPDKTVWALFPSSTDELASDPVFRDKQDLPWQHQWIEDILEIVSKYPHVHLVIRVHPNMGRTFWSNGESKDDLDWFGDLKERKLRNVTVIDAEEQFSSYELMDLATVGLSFSSTCSLEMALRGKHGCQACAAYGEGVADLAPDRKSLEECFERYGRLEMDATSCEIQKVAFRFLNAVRKHAFFPFPLVRMTSPVSSVLAYSSPEALRPGKDAALDVICDALLAGVRPDNLSPECGSVADDSAESETFRQLLDFHALGRRVCLERGEYLVPKDNVIGFMDRLGVSSPYCLTGWRQETDWYRKLGGRKATLAFSLREGGLSSLRVRWIVARDQTVTLSLNDRVLGTYTGTGWMQEVEASMPPDILEDLNFLTLSLPEQSGKAVINKIDRAVAVVQAVWFKNQKSGSGVSFTALCGGALAKLRMYSVLRNRCWKKRL